jgi:hypothetical protein
MRSLLATSLLLMLALSQATTQTRHPQETTVPVVGCPSDGQQGPQEAPKHSTKRISVPSEMAQQLAYYKPTDGPSVLGPRGWFCFGVYGSNGESTYVTPQPITSKEFFSDQWKGITGPAIQLSVSIGDTSGRFEVAQVIARVFPAHKSFVERVIQEGLEPASNFPFGKYPNDTLTYKGTSLVEDVTPPNAEGLGTASRLRPGDAPITGVEILSGEDPDLTSLHMRLPPPLNNLKPYILNQVERESSH